VTSSQFTTLKNDTLSMILHSYVCYLVVTKSSLEKDMKHYLTILFMLLFGFICASCSSTSGVKIAEENFVEDCGDKDCTKSNNSKDDFIRDEYLNKKEAAIFPANTLETKNTVATNDLLLTVKKKAKDISTPTQPVSVLFEFDKYTLDPEGKATLDKTAAILVKYSLYNLQLSGHTDNLGCHNYNIELSRKRAEEAKKYLAEKGIDPDRIITSWHSSNRPKASNETSDGRSQNRRVEFNFIKKDELADSVDFEKPLFLCDYHRVSANKKTIHVTS